LVSPRPRHSTTLSGSAQTPRKTIWGTYLETNFLILGDETKLSFNEKYIVYKPASQ
jgi:hypothetical protein